MRKVSSAGVAVAALALTACAGLPLPLAVGQPASFVIGQPGLEAGETGPAFLTNGWGHATILDGRLFIADTGAARIWMFDSVPNATRESPDAILGGDPGAEPAVAPFDWPLCIEEHEGRYYVADISQQQVSVWTQLPTGRRDYADATLITGFGHLEGLTIVDGKMVTSSPETKVRIWRTVPRDGTADDGSPVILAKAGGVPFAAAYRHWTDGTRLLVADSENHRVLGWNSLPAKNDQEPDFVLGQSAMDCGGACSPGRTRETLNLPYAVASNGRQIFVRDNGNCRVMVWNSFPRRNGAPADVVLGQADFTSGECNRGHAGEGGTSAATLCAGYDVFFGDGKLFVGDEPGDGSARWLVFTSQPRPGATR